MIYSKIHRPLIGLLAFFAGTGQAVLLFFLCLSVVSAALNFQQDAIRCIFVSGVGMVLTLAARALMGLLPEPRSAYFLR